MYLTTTTHHLLEWDTSDDFPFNRRFGMRFFHLNKHHHIVAAVREKHLFVRDEHPIQLLNLSATGSLIAIDNQLEANRNVHISLYLNGELFEYDAKVIRKNTDFCYGLQFSHYIDDIERYATEFEQLPRFGMEFSKPNRIADLPDI